MNGSHPGIAVLIVVSLLLGGVCRGAERIALVIGNARYAHMEQVRTASGDAKAVGSALGEAGFDVIQVEDASAGKMTASLEQLKTRSKDAKVGLIYFSGHGAEIAGKNYLFPVEAELLDASQLDAQAIPLDAMLEVLAEAGFPVKVAILDCCRDPGIARAWISEKSTGRGGLLDIPKERVPAGTLVMYSAGIGEAALEGVSSLSPFASSLAARIALPGQSLSEMVLGTARDVVDTTGKLQSPWISANVGEQIFRDVAMPAGGALSPAERTLLEDWRDDPDGTERRAAEVVRKYLDAKSVDELVTHVRQRDRVEPLIREFYRGRPFVTPGCGKVEKTAVVEKFASVSVDTKDYERLQIVVAKEDGELKVDWECHVGRSDMDWKDFIKRQVEQPTMFRVKMEKTSYYNFGFSNEEEWSSFKILSPDEEHLLYGYVKRGSELEGRLDELFSNERSGRLVMPRLKYPEGEKGRNQVLIDSLISGSWILETE